MNFDMNKVWDRSVELMRDNFQLLVLISGLFILLPLVAMYLFLPTLSEPPAIAPGASPEQVLAVMGDMFAPLVIPILLTTIAQFAGNAAMVALMGPVGPTVGQALTTGIKALPSLLASWVIFIVVYLIGAFLVMIPFGLIGAATGSAALVFVGYLPVLILSIWLMARLSLTMPAIAIGGLLNPVKAMLDSFKLTGPKQWRIALFWFVLLFVLTIISLIANGIVGVIAAITGTGVTAKLILGIANGATSMLTAIVMCAVAAAMYTRLTGPATAEIEETFE